MSGHSNECEDQKERRAKARASLDDALRIIASDEYGHRVITPAEFIEVMRRLLAVIDAD